MIPRFRAATAPLSKEGYRQLSPLSAIDKLFQVGTYSSLADAARLEDYLFDSRVSLAIVDLGHSSLHSIELAS